MVRGRAVGFKVFRSVAATEVVVHILGCRAAPDLAAWQSGESSSSPHAFLELVLSPPPPIHPGLNPHHHHHCMCTHACTVIVVGA